MKTQLLTLALFGILFQNPLFAQDVTTVNATSNEISDNLDLRAVASIFGDSNNLEDFERRLNDPKNQISNLDLNFDRQVDYLRVIEAVERNTHLIILQAVLERDVFQDVATIEVERDRNNQVQVQVVGDVFMYGQNYIYEPVYVRRPIIYNTFWVANYNPYCSPYFYNYYPNYYYAWTPFPLYRYKRNVHIHINQYNYYNYSNQRRSSRAITMYQTRRNNGYERQYPNQSFSTRNKVTNRYELETTRNSGTRLAANSTRNVSSNENATRNNATTRNTISTTNNTVRTTNSNSTIRNSTPANNVRNNTSKTDAITRSNTVSNNVRNSSINSNTTRSSTPKQNVRTTSRTETPRNLSQNQPTRQVQQSSNATRNSIQRKETPSANSRSTNTSSRTRSNNRS